MDLVAEAVSAYHNSVNSPEEFGQEPAIRAACNAGLNALAHEAMPQSISEVPLLAEWYDIGLRAAKHVGHVCSTNVQASAS